MSKSDQPITTSPTDTNLSLDAIHGLLSTRRRRYTLYYLYLNENPVAVTDLADQVAEWEHDETPLPENCQRTYTTLYHAHIPKLEAAGAVTYHQDDDTLELARNAACLRPHLEQAAGVDLHDRDSLPL